jgi:hypothetical protein
MSLTPEDLEDLEVDFLQFIEKHVDKFGVPLLCDVCIEICVDLLYSTAIDKHEVRGIVENSYKDGYEAYKREFE